jgi:hypothetical protein
MNQSQFDFGESQRRKESGMAKAKGRAGAILWQQNVSRWFFTLPVGTVFCPDDVVRACGLPSANGGANTQNAVGAWINGMARAKFIRWTGRLVRSERTQRHAGEAREWQKIKG